MIHNIITQSGYVSKWECCLSASWHCSMTLTGCVIASMTRPIHILLFFYYIFCCILLFVFFQVRCGRKLQGHVEYSSSRGFFFFSIPFLWASPWPCSDYKGYLLQAEVPLTPVLEKNHGWGCKVHRERDIWSFYSFQQN